MPPVADQLFAFMMVDHYLVRRGRIVDDSYHSTFGLVLPPAGRQRPHPVDFVPIAIVAAADAL